MSDVVQDEEGTGYRFSWGLAFAGAVIAAAVTLFLLTLGAGVGLLLVHPGDNLSIPHFLTGGAIYFFAAQAFGFAVGGHVAGRLLGPLPETYFQEEVRAAIHGLVVWALAVLGTVVMLAAAGTATAALYGITRTAGESQRGAAIIVDRLFRPGQTVIRSGPANPTAVPPPAVGAANPIEQPAASPPTVTITQPVPGDGTQARAEAGRLIEAGGTFTTDDRARLTQLVSQQAGVSQREASLRVATIESQLTERIRRTAEIARKATSYASLWVAFSLLFGAVVAMVAAVTARLEDNRETAWTLFAFRGRR